MTRLHVLRASAPALIPPALIGVGALPVNAVAALALLALVAVLAVVLAVVDVVRSRRRAAATAAAVAALNVYVPRRPSTWKALP